MDEFEVVDFVDKHGHPYQIFFCESDQSVYISIHDPITERWFVNKNESMYSNFKYNIKNENKNQDVQVTQDGNYIVWIITNGNIITTYIFEN